MDSTKQKSGKIPGWLVALFLVGFLILLIGGSTMVTSLFLHFIGCMGE